MDPVKFIILSFGAVFLNNFVFSRFIGVNPSFINSKKPGLAAVIGLAVTFFMTAASAALYPVYIHLLVPYGLDKFLATPVFVIICFTIIELTEFLIKTLIPSFKGKFAKFMPLLTVNSAVLGAVLIIIHDKYDFLTGIIYSFSSGLGFMFAMVIMAGISERLQRSKVPAAFSGLPIMFISASLIALALYGLIGIFK
jgi:electron transport complex protein RnfA